MKLIISDPMPTAASLSLAEKENSGTQYTMNDFKAMVQKISNTLKYQEAKVLARSIQRQFVWQYPPRQ